MAASQPKFMILGKSKYVHVITTKSKDMRDGGAGSQCQQVRKFHVAGKMPKGSGLSVEAAAALDPCPNCNTAEAIKAMETPEQKRERAKERAKETLDKIRYESLTKAQKAKKSKSSKPKKERVGKAGRASAGDTRAKAEALAAFGKEHGWSVGVDEANPGLVVTAVRGAETITCFFVDGKYDTTRHASLAVGDWRGKLRGVHGCRKQMAGEGRERPHPEPGKGRSGPRSRHKVSDDDEVSEDESPEDAKRRVPFSLDDEALVIIDMIKGKTIKWRNGTTHKLEEAWLPADANGKKRSKITITEHPKTGKRMINFLTVTSVGEHGEQYGPERTVYLDKIVRVS